MKRDRKYHLPIPSRMEIDPSDAEIIEAPGKNKQPVGTPVQLIPTGPPVEIVEALPRTSLFEPDRPLNDAEPEKH